ncbi:MAG: hypothetical protein U1E54_04415 [Candidatus Levybacteria bacterium]|nr:hypothetical protein [Candidatus Levybacteria bacterium]
MVIFKKPWIFFAAFGLGLFLDLLDLRNIGYTSLILAIFVFVIWLYERKFETQTISFVFIATFFGSIIYLMVFGYHMVFLQAFINALVAVVIFRVIPNLFRDPTLNKTEMLK